MNICSKCVLPESFPGIRFNQEGVCQYCSSAKPLREMHDLQEKYRNKFCKLIGEFKSQGPYDIVMAYSGGKDSSYTLKILKNDFGLRVLAITFDNGFVSEQALKNIKKVTGTLNVDHLMISPGFALLSNVFNKSITSKLYPLKALERASSICNTCMNLVKSYVLKTAIENGISFIAYGWSPGQAPIQSSVMALNQSMIQQMQKMITNTLQEIMGDDLSPFILSDRHYALIKMKLSDSTNGLFYNIHPLAFLKYDETHIVESIKRIGWEEPMDTDANSTNCLLNSFANVVHQEVHGFHPYAFEIAGLVRNGHMSREDGLKKLSIPADKNTIAYVKQKLRID